MSDSGILRLLGCRGKGSNCWSYSQKHLKDTTAWLGPSYYLWENFLDFIYFSVFHGRKFRMIQYWSRSTTTSTQSLTWSHESYRWTWQDMPVTQTHGGWDVSIAMVSETDRGRKKKVRPQGLVIGWNQTCILNFYFQSWNEQTVKSEQCLSIEETKVVLFCFWSWNWIQGLTHGRQKLYTKLSNIPNLLFILYFIGVSFL